MSYQGSESVEALLVRFDSAPLSAADRWELGKRAERLAEEAGNEELLYAIRLRLVESAHTVVDAQARLSLFLWCAHKHDSDPVRFPAKPVPGNENIDLLWAYKWLTEMMCAWPQYSLRQLRSAIDMMRSAYARAGVGRAGVLWAEFNLANEVGSDNDVREALARIRSTPVDDYSNCDACSRACEISTMIASGDDDKALRLFDELLAGGFTCAEEPEMIISECLGLLLRSGRSHKAVALQERSYPRIMNGPLYLSAQCQHMMFFLATGNPARAYDLLFRHVSGLWHDGLSPAAQLGAFTSLLRITTLLSREGMGHLPIPGTHAARARRVIEGPQASATDSTAPYTLDQFVPLAKARAEELAAQFDARNGHERARDAVRSAADPELTVTPIDLGGTATTGPALNSVTTMVPGSPREVGSFREWMDLAYEIKHMNGVNDGGRSVMNANTLASNPSEKFESFVALLQVEDRSDFAENLQRYVEFLRSVGQHEYADASDMYGWRLWTDYRPSAIAPDLEDPPLLDPLTALADAKTPLWRLELALALVRDVAVHVTSQFEQWDDEHPDFVKWDREATARIESTWRVPRPLWEEHADLLHKDLRTILAHSELPSWHFLVAYAIAQARITPFEFSVLETFRCASNSFTAVPPASGTVTNLLELQAQLAREHGSAALELAAYWGLTTVSVYSGTERDPEWDERIEAAARKVHHPYLSVRLRSDSAVTAAAVGDHAKAVRLFREAVIVFDACEHLRPIMAESERNFTARPRLLEQLFTELIEAGLIADAVGLGPTVIGELRATDSAVNRDRRLVEALLQNSTAIVETGTGDVYTAIEYLNDAAEIAQRVDSRDEDWLFLRANIHLSLARVNVMFGDGEGVLEHGHKAAEAIETFPASLNEDAAQLYLALASFAMEFDGQASATWLLKAEARRA